MDAPPPKPAAEPPPLHLVKGEEIAVPETLLKVLLVDWLYGLGRDDAGNERLIAIATLQVRGPDGTVQQVEWETGHEYAAHGRRFRILVQRYDVFLYALPPAP